MTIMPNHVLKRKWLLVEISVTFLVVVVYTSGYSGGDTDSLTVETVLHP